MQDFCVYQIEVKGQVDEKSFNTKGPLQMTVIRVDTESTLFTIYTDQSGLIGLMRHLHNQGFVFLSLSRER